MEYIFKNLGNVFKDLIFRPVELQSLWQNKPGVAKLDKVGLIAKQEATVRIHDGRLMSVSADLPATHKVVSCIRTANNHFELTILSLADSQLSVITLV